MTHTTDVTVDLSGISEPPVVTAKQGDTNSRILKVTLLDNGVPFTLTGVTIARIGMTKPDGEQILNDAIINGNEVLVTLTTQMLMAAGDGNLEIMLFSDEVMLSSAVIRLHIYEAAYVNDLIMSVSELLSLVELLIKLNSSIVQSESATTAAIEATTASQITTALCEQAVKACQEATQAALDAAYGYTVITVPGTSETNTVQNVINMIWGGQNKLQCPIHGSSEMLQDILYHIVDTIKPSALTYAELKEKEITYAELKAKNITYHNLAFYGKDILT